MARITHFESGATTHAHMLDTPYRITFMSLFMGTAALLFGILMECSW